MPSDLQHRRVVRKPTKTRYSAVYFAVLYKNRMITIENVADVQILFIRMLSQSLESHVTWFGSFSSTCV